ncbi:MAG: FliM/FliN family flagellar motor switch protein [Terracidiphilus sp.]
MKTFMDCWAQVAADLFQQALAGEPELVDSLPKPFAAGSFGFVATVAGDEKGRFVIVLDTSILEAPLLGEGADQKAGWAELLQETLNAAAGELLAKTGKKCRVEKFEESSGEAKVTRAFQLKSGDRSWTILVRDEVRTPKPEASAEADLPSASHQARTPAGAPAPSLTPGLELLLDVELEASLRFGCREMPLGEILDLGPGDVVQLDRHVSDPVDLIVGDKIVARGEVVLVNGNFGLRVTEVAAPRKRLKSIRCLF